MEDEKRQRLEELGWSCEMLDLIKHDLHYESINEIFLERTQQALSAVGCTALRFLIENPCLSTAELAKRLNRGASAIGVIIAAYQEAVDQGTVRAVAQDMLVRTIIREYPNGWTANGSVHPAVKIGSWHSELATYTRNADFGRHAERIIRSLAIDDPPNEGWIPLCQNDRLIEKVFATYWPVNDKSYSDLGDHLQ